MIRRINAVVLFVKDLKRAIEFYKDIIGVEVIFTDDVSSALRLENQDFALLSEDYGVELLSEEALGLHAGGGHRVMLCADIDDVDDAYNRLMAKGVSFIKPPADQTWGWRTAYFTDPDGHIWELRQSIPVQS